MPVYAVGGATARAVETGLEASPRGMDTGSATELAGFIAADYVGQTCTAGGGAVADKRMRPLLFPCSRLARLELTDTLAAAGVPVERVTAYDTRALDGASSEVIATITSAIDDGRSPVWVAFFSPSGVSTVLPDILAAAPEWPSGVVRFAAIGKTTATAIERAGATVDAVAPSPNPEGLMSVIVKGT